MKLLNCKKNVGGRYSIWSAVGVLPLSLVYGYDIIEDFLNGAREADIHFKTTDPENNIPLILGALSIHNTTDWDVFAVSMTNGLTYWMNTTFTHSNGDLDIYFTDANLNILSSSTSSTDDESTSWTANSTGTFYGVVLGYLGDTNSYGITLEGGQSSNASGDVSVVFYNATYGELTSLNLTSGISYDLDVHLLVPNGSNFTSVASYTDSWTSNGSNHMSPAYITLAEENLFCLYGELYDMSQSSNGIYVADSMDCLYHEMMEASVTSDTSASLDAQNITSGSYYTYEWGLYISGASNFSQTGNGSFTASSSSWSSTATWNQPNSGLEHCFYVELSFNGSVIGGHEDCFDPTWPSLEFTGYVANSNSTTNPIYFDTSNLTVGNNYQVQVGIVEYSTNNTTSISSVTNFTASNSTESWNWDYTTPSTSGYYCMVGTLWDASGAILDSVSLPTANSTSNCFLIVHDDDNDGVWNMNDLCPNTPANSTVDLNGCAASQRDTDNDGVNDALDPFPFDGTQWQDSDGDGYGDNASGNNPDAFPNDSTQWSDGDGDGYGDNPSGTNADAFPTDSTQWADADGDGYGDNPSGNNPDAFPSDATQHSDGDGDGYGDNPQGNNPDSFPTDSTQWADRDGDGYGDNPQGNNPDQCPDTPAGETVDSTGCSATERDSDGDGVMDAVDDCLHINASGWDNDGDGCIDDTDGDGYDDPDDDCVNEDSTGFDADHDGCIDDSDGDLVKDDVDQCPTTNASGFDGDLDGCIDDSDGDLVPDDVDDCRYVNATGFDNDGDGCIDDTDGDNIKDNIDSCPYENATGFDDNQDGCLDDSDSDGVKDNADICPNTVDYLTIDIDGCSDHQRDSDSDTVKDFYDVCPDTITGQQVNTDGCSASQRDTDGDTVSDADDTCPETDSGATVDLFGCADTQRDTDNDGVNDSLDQCPTTPTNENANNLGCSDSEWDSDGDGFMDSEDDCINEGGSSTTDRVGCIDSDQDGVSDLNDAYPNDATKQAASDNADEGGFSPIVVALVGMFVLFSIVAGAVVVLRMRSGDEEEQFAGGLTMQPAVSLTEMAMPAQAATELGLQTANESLVATESLATPDADPEQWVDENGVTWHRQPDGVLLRWNGEAWEPAN